MKRFKNHYDHSFVDDVGNFVLIVHNGFKFDAFYNEFSYISTLSYNNHKLIVK